MKRTPLHSLHQSLHARMSPFAGYEMPISYDSVTGGMLKEHLAVRHNVGMFDVSHMGEFWIRGPEATQFLTHVCTRPFENLENFKAQYCLLLSPQGSIIDDIIVYRYSAEKYWMVVNASNVAKDFEHLQKYADNFRIELEDASERTALIAVQGPNAVNIVTKLLGYSIDSLKYYHFTELPSSWIVARTGYTGEDGFEIFLPAKEAANFWNQLRAKDVIPIGLGARDTLRLEVGFSLYGHELSEELFPLETFSAFAVSPSSKFLGSDMALKTIRYRPIAIEALTPKPIREGERLFTGNIRVGRVTSGSTSPLKRLGIGLALIEISQLPDPKNFPNVFMLESGGKQREAVLTKTPFVSTARVKVSKGK